LFVEPLPLPERVIVFAAKAGVAKEFNNKAPVATAVAILLFIMCCFTSSLFKSLVLGTLLTI
jgi:hypothetical protein